MRTSFGACDDPLPPTSRSVGLKPGSNKPSESICLPLPVLSLCLSACLPAYVSQPLSLGLSLCICLPACLPVCLPRFHPHPFSIVTHPFSSSTLTAQTSKLASVHSGFHHICSWILQPIVIPFSEQCILYPSLSPPFPRRRYSRSRVPKSAYLTFPVQHSGVENCIKSSRACFLTQLFFVLFKATLSPGTYRRRLRSKAPPF